MTRFRCVPIPTETADRFRSAGLDDRGNPIRRVAATANGGFPCRHCLRLGQPGESMLLGSYDLPEPRGIYWTPSPIFLHARDCPRAETVDELAPIVRANALESNVRFYKVTAGRRVQLAGADLPVTAGAWHELAITAREDRFAVSFDGRELFTAVDETFRSPGKIAFWTKADSVTWFDRLDVEELR